MPKINCFTFKYSLINCPVVHFFPAYFDVEAIRFSFVVKGEVKNSLQSYQFNEKLGPSKFVGVFCSTRLSTSSFERGK